VELFSRAYGVSINI